MKKTEKKQDGKSVCVKGIPLDVHARLRAEAALRGISLVEMIRQICINHATKKQ